MPRRARHRSAPALGRLGEMRGPLGCFAPLRAGPWPVGDNARTVHYLPPLRAGPWPVGCGARSVH